MQAGQRVATHIVRTQQSLQHAIEFDTVKLFIGHGASFRHAAHILGVLEFNQLARLSMFHGKPVLIDSSKQQGWHHVEGEWKVRGIKQGLD